MNQDMRAEYVQSSTKGAQITPQSPRVQKNGIISTSSNGKVSSNGESESYTNGFSASQREPRSHDFHGHDREEVTRLLIQGLGDLGYEDSARRLSQESGYEVESPTVAAFRQAVLNGDWRKAESLLFRPDAVPDGGGVSLRNGTAPGSQPLDFIEGVDRDYMKFIIREQKYLELLERQDTAQALLVLQTELQPLRPALWDRSRLNGLSELLVCKFPEDLMAQARWDGSGGQSRPKLLQELSKSISASVIIPDHRLVQLLDQIKQAQISKCLYHNPLAPLSLFTDHMCDRNEFPLQTIRELSENEGEVFSVDFSHNGKYLAASGSAKIVVIYDTATWEVRHRLSEHENQICHLAWSPDDSRLITCSVDKIARIWDLKTGRRIFAINHHSEPATGAAWAPDGQSFVTCSLASQDQLCLWDADCQKLHGWKIDYRVTGCAISPDGQKLVTTSLEPQIYVYNLATWELEYNLQVPKKPTSVSISRDSRYMLISTSDNDVYLYDIESADVVRKYTGKKQGNFIIRSSFGGSDENMVISGSEDAKIYIWHKENGTLIEELQGHSGCVNAVTWNPADPGMFASGGDDKIVRIWAKEPKPNIRRRKPVRMGSTFEVLAQSMRRFMYSK